MSPVWCHLYDVTCVFIPVCRTQALGGKSCVSSFVCPSGSSSDTGGRSHTSCSDTWTHTHLIYDITGLTELLCDFLIGRCRLTWVPWWAGSCRCGSGQCDWRSDWRTGDTEWVTIATGVAHFAATPTCVLQWPLGSAPVGTRRWSVCRHDVHPSPAANLCTHPVKTRPHCRLHFTKHSLLLHRRRDLTTQVLVRQRRRGACWEM